MIDQGTKNPRIPRQDSEGFSRWFKSNKKTGVYSVKTFLVTLRDQFKVWLSITIDGPEV